MTSPRDDKLARRARARRGWIPGGPPPAGDPADPAWAPGPGETLDALSGDWCLYQLQDCHRYSLDDQLTADYAARAALDRGAEVRRALDLGCGVGSVLLMLAWRFPAARCEGVEAQAASAALARRSLAFNGVSDRVRVHHADLRDHSPDPASPRADLVSGTPPYIPYGEGTVSERPQCDPCRFEQRGGVEGYLSRGASWLAPGGVMALCFMARARDRVLAAARDVGLALWRLQDVIGREGKPALITLFAFVAGDEAPLVEEAPLVVRDREGRRTPAYGAVRARMGFPP